MKYMLDANVLRHLACRQRGYLNIIDKIEEVGVGVLCMSTIATAELHKAINNHKLERTERKTIKDMLAAITVHSFSEKEAEAAGVLAAEALRRGITLPTPDYMIAGHAHLLGLVVVTDNVKHFAGAAGLKVENWLRP